MGSGCWCFHHSLCPSGVVNPHRRVFGYQCCHMPFTGLYSYIRLYVSIHLVWPGGKFGGRIDEFSNNLFTRFFIIHLQQMLVVSTISINGGSHFPIFPSLLARRTWSPKQHTTAIVEIGQSQRSFLTGKFVGHIDPNWNPWVLGPWCHEAQVNHPKTPKAPTLRILHWKKPDEWLISWTFFLLFVCWLWCFNCSIWNLISGDTKKNVWDIIYIPMESVSFFFLGIEKKTGFLKKTWFFKIYSNSLLLRRKQMPFIEYTVYNMNIPTSYTCTSVHPKPIHLITHWKFQTWCLLFMIFSSARASLW